MKTDVISIENLSYGTHERNKLDLYLPPINSGTAGLILFIHGGAWIEGDKDSYRDTAKNICASHGFATATMNYRYISESSDMNDILTDIDNAVKFIKDTAESNNISIRKMLLTGHSAGGHLSMIYAYSMADKAAIIPAAVANYCGPSDLNDEGFYANNSLGGFIYTLLHLALHEKITPDTLNNYRDKIAVFSPITYINESTVPTIINHGMKDFVVPYSNALKLKEKFEEYKIPYILNPFPNSGHDLAADTECESFAYEKMLEFADKYLL